MESAHQWFSQSNLRLAGKVLNYIILHPITRELVSFAGKPYVEEYRQHFVEAK